MGADAPACAALAGGADVKAFFVRKESKAHGLQRKVEGPPLVPGERCLIVEDVVTSGGSTVQAIEAVRAEGYDVVGVVSVLDRLAGGAAAIALASGDAPMRLWRRSTTSTRIGRTHEPRGFGSREQVRAGVLAVRGPRACLGPALDCLWTAARAIVEIRDTETNNDHSLWRSATFVALGILT